MSGSTKNKLSQEDVQNILSEVKAGVSKNVVARKYGVDHSLIYYYLKRKQKTETKFWPEIREIETKEIKEKEIKEKKEKEIKEIKEIKEKREKFVKKTSSSYKELLAIENEKRKAKGLYLFKTPTKGFYK